MKPLHPDEYREIVRRALDEDIGSGDVTTEATVGADRRGGGGVFFSAHCAGGGGGGGRGVFLVKADCVVAGLDVALEAFRLLDPGIGETVHRRDGDRCQAGEEIAEPTGTRRTPLSE